MSDRDQVWPIWMTACAALVLCLAVLCSPALADRRVALVVANAAYGSAPLSNPAVDLGLIVPALEDLGFSVTSVRDADLAGFDGALAAFAETAKNADVALFYFAGHGFAVNDGVDVRNYLMSTSADVSSNSDRVIRAGGIALDEIIAQLGGAKTALIFVDACRNDPRVQRGTSSRGLAAIDRSNAGSIFVGLSTRVGSTAADGNPGEGSPFARAFVAHIGEPNLRVDDAFTRVRIDVERETESRQRPDVGLYELDAPVVLRTASLQPIEAADPALATWSTVKDSSSPAILQSFAESFPDSVYARLALARIKELQTGASEPAASGNLGGSDAGGEESSPDLLASLPAGAKDVPDDNPGSRKTGAVPIQLCDTLASTRADMFVDFYEIDTQRAITACTAAIREYPDEPRFSFQLGRAFHAGNDFRKAMSAFRTAADAGFSEAMTLLGTFYAQGIVEIQNCDTAEHWLIKAVRSGDALRALRELSQLYGNCPEVADAGKSNQLLFLSLIYGNDETWNEIRTGDAFKDRAAITRLQTFLKDRGLYTGTVDGRMGSGTEAALTRAHEYKWHLTTLDDEDFAVFEKLVARR